MKNLEDAIEQAIFEMESRYQLPTQEEVDRMKELEKKLLDNKESGLPPSLKDMKELLMVCKSTLIPAVARQEVSKLRALKALASGIQKK